MSVIVAVPDAREGKFAIAAGLKEAELLDTNLVLVNLGLRSLDCTMIPDEIAYNVLERHGDDGVHAVLEAIAADESIERLVVCPKRRSATGKALFGSVSQDLILQSPIPVLSVTAPHA